MTPVALMTRSMAIREESLATRVTSVCHHVVSGADVTLPPERLQEVVSGQRAALIWGGTANLAPVDDILISVERPLGCGASNSMEVTLDSDGTANDAIVFVSAQTDDRYVAIALAFLTTARFASNARDAAIKSAISS